MVVDGSEDCEEQVVVVNKLFESKRSAEPRFRAILPSGEVEKTPKTWLLES